MSDLARRDSGEDYDDGAVSVEDLRELRRQRDAARSAAQSAETARQRAERELHEARGTAGSQTIARFAAEEAAIDGMISSAEAEASALESQIASLNAEGNFAEAARQHRSLARAEARIENLQQRKQQFSAARAHEEEQFRAQQQQQPRSTLSQRQQDWVNAHPDFNSDERINHRVQAAHFAARADGIPEGSDEYFERLDEAYTASSATKSRSSSRSANGYDDEGEEPPAAPRRPQQLPVSRRGVESDRASEGGPIRLSPDQREAADITYSDVPQEDWVDRQGNTQPGRYRLYHKYFLSEKKAGRVS